jgi:hypothetical protein
MHRSDYSFDEPERSSASAYSRSAVFLFLLSLAVLSACNSQPSTRILIIGNSYTFFNGGLEKQLAGLAPSAEVASIAIAGYSLENHWKAGKALKEIRSGTWNFVVLQEQSQLPVVDRNRFSTYARLFDEEIRKSGAQTVLLMTWERPDSRAIGVTTENLAASITAVGKALNARVAPAGLAFARSLQEKPDLPLCSQDGHPTAEGTHLAASVLYRTIFEFTPAGNPSSQRGHVP